jgi:hypothetical protein
MTLQARFRRAVEVQSSAWEYLMRLRIIVFLLLPAAAAHAAEVKGKVTNAVGGEALIKTLQGLPLTPTAGVVFQF